MLKVQWVELDEVKPYGGNPRRRSELSVKKIAASLKEFGWQQPIVADEFGVIIVGHGRRDAASVLIAKSDPDYKAKYGSKVPVVYATDLTPDQVSAYRLADNRTNEETEWDEDLLKVELKALDMGKYDLELTAFDEDELKRLLGELEGGGPAEGEEDVPECLAEAVTRRGEVWLLGRHRLMCADSTSLDDVKALLNGAKLNMVYTDPPYGVEIVNADGKVSTGLPPGPALRGKVGGDKAFGKVGTIHKGMKAKPIIEANNYAPIIGDDSIETAVKSYQVCAALKIPTMIFWGGNYYASALPDSSCWIVWDKDNGQSFFADAELAWTNKKTAVRIFKHQWNGLIKASERGEKRCHPTQKPVALADWCFEKYGEDGDNVLDLFSGSAASLIACEKTKRTWFGMEMAEHYCDVGLMRWEKFTGKKALLESDGRTFDEVKADRIKQEVSG